MEKHPNSPRSRFFAGLVILGCLAVTPVFGQTLTASLALDNDRYTLGQKFTLSLIVENADPAVLVVTQPVYPDNIRLIEGPSSFPSTWEKSPGVTVKVTKVSFTFRAAGTGIVNVGPFGLSSGSANVTVPPRTLFLLREDEAQRRFPLEVRWITPPGPFYKGQDIPLVLQVRNLQNLVKPQDVSLIPPSGAILEKVVGLGDIEISSLGEDRLFHIPWGSWICIPSAEGTFNLPTSPFSVQGLTRSTPPLSLAIQSLPPEVEASRAVGEFTFNSDARVGQGDQSGQLVIRQTLKGKGNFPYLVMPPLELTGFKLLGRQETAGFRPSSGGYQGTLQVTYRFAPEAPGAYNLTLPGFTWFNPLNQKTFSLPAKTVSFQFDALGTHEVGTTDAPQLLDWDAVVASRSLQLIKGWGWLGLLPGLLLFIIIVTGRKKGPPMAAVGIVLLLSAALPMPDNFKQAYDASVAASPEAQGLWDAYLAQNPQEPGVWYNKATLYEKADQTAMAVHAYRMALAQGFSGEAATRALSQLELREALVDQWSSWTGFSQDLIFIGFLIAAGGALMVLALSLRRRTAVLVIVTVLLLSVSIFLGGTAVFAQDQISQAQAVLGPSDSPIRRAPGDLSEEWLILKKGTSLRILGTTGDFSLVQTAYGLEGWVKQEYLLRLK